jgi:hypothetical protein
VTRDQGERAERESSSRGLTPGAEPDRVSAEEWLEEHRRSVEAEDEIGPVTELDLPAKDEQVVGRRPVGPHRAQPHRWYKGTYGGHGDTIGPSSVALGMENANVIPGPSFGVAQRRPPWLSMMDRLTDRPIPMPSLLVV